jgi:hypothetical protein
MVDEARKSGFLKAWWRFLTLRQADGSALTVHAPLLYLLGYAAAWLLYDRLTAGEAPDYFPISYALLAWYGLAVVLLAAWLRSRAFPVPSIAAVLALISGMVPILLVWVIVGGMLLSGRWLTAATVAVYLYLLCYLVRGMRSLSGPGHVFPAAMGWLFLLVFVALSNALDVVPDVWQPQDAAVEPLASTDNSLADQEALLFGQSGRIDAAIERMQVPADDAPHAFFVGFAGVGSERVFTQEIELAQRVMGERFGTGARSLALVNDERNLEAAPLASPSALAYALKRIAGRMNQDRDVLFLAISSHGSEDPAIAVENSELPLDDLTDTALAAALNESGIRWRVIIISACYAGGFIDALRNPHTIIITAAAPDRTSFGCGTDSELTYFGEAFYRDALPKASSLHEAFESARAAIGRREHRERVEPSEPQADFAPGLETKLKLLEKRE